VWIKVATTDATSIVVYVKQVEYREEEDGSEGWVYKVQEQDEDAAWCGSERWKREKALKSA
jgi:hypothetical protein